MAKGRTLFLAAALTVGAAFWTAGDAAAQVAAQETYQLTQVAGQPLPAVVEESGNCRDELTGATLTLSPDGTWTLVTTENEICGAQTEEEGDTEDGTYTIEGETIDRSASSTTTATSRRTTGTTPSSRWTTSFRQPARPKASRFA